MINTRFLKKNNSLAIAILTLALFLLSVFYLDKLYITWLWEFKNSGSLIYTAIDTVYPFLNYGSNGLIFLVGALLLFVLGRFLNKRFNEIGVLLCAGFAVTGIFTQLLKHIVGRARPKLTDKFVWIGPTLESKYDSFPSGHTAVAFCFAYMLSKYYPKYKAFFYMLAVIVGAGRLKVPSHFISDVLAGAVIGLLFGKLTTYYFARFISRREQ